MSLWNKNTITIHYLVIYYVCLMTFLDQIILDPHKLVMRINIACITMKWGWVNCLTALKSTLSTLRSLIIIAYIQRLETMPAEDVFTVTAHHLSTSSFSHYQHLTQRTLLDVSSFTILSQNVHKSAKRSL